MSENALQGQLLDIIKNFGDIGVFIAMFLESSIVPIPSEVIIVSAGALGISLVSIVTFGSLGAVCGGSIGYLIGRYAALPIIFKYGKYVFIKPEYIYKAEAFAKKYGPPSVLIGRLIPIIPFKVFSIASGIAKLPFIPFIIFTFIGVVPRLFLLSLFGLSLIKYTKPAILATIIALVLYILYKKKWLKF